MVNVEFVGWLSLVYCEQSLIELEDQSDGQDEVTLAI